VKELVRPESIIVTTLSSPSLWYGALRHSGDQLVSVFHKYSLGCDTIALSRLYARLCHAFSSPVFIIFYS